MPPKKDPGRDPEMAERTRTLNVVFALSSIALLVSMTWMIWADYDREWKRYQIDFNRFEIAQAEAQIAEVDAAIDPQQREAIEQRLAEGQQAVAQRRDLVSEIDSELKSLAADWYSADQDFRFTKAEIDVARFEYDESVHSGASNATRRKTRLDELNAAWNAHRLRREQIEARQVEAEARLAEVDGTMRDAERELGELFAERNRLVTRLDDIQPGLISLVRNLPVIDMFNPSLKVKQILPANLYDDVIFTDTEKVDRCTTCHLGIDRQGFEDAPQPFTTHPNLELYLQGPHPIDKIGCTTCHLGRGRGTSFQKATHTPSSKEQEVAWGKYIGDHEYHALHHWDAPMLAKGHTESQCLKCHKDELVVPEAPQLNEGMILVERFGCYGCHKIKGWEGIRKAGPDLAKVASKTGEDWMYRWIENPDAFRPNRMPQFWNVRIDETAELGVRNTAEIDAVTKYVMSKSEVVEYPDPPRGDLERGRDTFETVGCLACHRVGDDMRGIEGLTMASPRAHGPNLAGTGSKLDAGWLFAWIQNPSDYWHETRMPKLRLTSREAGDITAYLMSLENEEFLAGERAEPDAAVRDQIVREYLLEKNTVKDTDVQLAAMSDAEKELYLGERTIARYGCFGCHNIPGFETATPIGTELSEQGSKLVERLDFGFEHETIPHTLPAWLHRKLMEPRIFDRDKEKEPKDLLKMGKFHLSDEEASAIVTAIMSFTKEQIPAAARKVLDAEERHVQAGQRLIRDKNCEGCHTLGAYGGAIEAVIEDRLVRAGGDAFQASALAPPMLYNYESKIGEGARVHSDWLHDFLRDPSTKIRPWLEIRMPTFDFTDEELNLLTRYFASLDRVQYPVAPTPERNAEMIRVGADLFERWQCVRCHVVAGKLPDQVPANMAPDLALVTERLRPAWLTEWLRDPARILPGTNMPTNFPENPEENAFPEILGGDQDEQIEAVRQYLLTLGAGGR